MRKTEIITALDVQNGDLIRVEGYRVLVSDCEKFPASGRAEYRCHSEPLEGEPRLPPTYEGMHSGGNSGHRLHREISE